jgi:hypothetical protein
MICTWLPMTSQCHKPRQASKLVSAARNQYLQPAASRKISLSFDQNFGLVIG